MRTERELTARALLSGVVLGALLTPCNVYSGLKIGWSFNMSIVALLLSLGGWRAAERAAGAARWSQKESNIAQTAASAAASIVSGGLVAPIPAYTLITGERLGAGPMTAWVFAVSFLGIWVAWALRPSLIEDSPLRFPAGAATLETLRDVFGRGREALARVAVLLGAALASGLLKSAQTLARVPGEWSPSALAAKYTFTLVASPLLAGFGAIVGLRVGASLLAGALLAWGWLGPWLLASGRVSAAGASGSLFEPLVAWLLWPGVSLMVSATLAGLALRLAPNASRRAGAPRMRLPAPSAPALAGFALACALTVALQVELFGISLALALLAIPLALVLAVVAARVVGETGIPPIGAIGKVSQLGIGVAAPGQAVTNLMAANVAGGAAGQCADLLNDFKAGHGIGASPARQSIAQCAGVLTGSAVGVAVYLALIPDPGTMLLTEQWPAPAVAVWKAVAEALAQGLGSVPPSARAAMLVAAVAGVILGALESRPRAARWLPSAASLGLAFVIPASVSLMIFAGALAAWLFARSRPALAERFTLAAAAGMITGESLVGVAAAIVGLTGT
jgi:uncharacterized oligopeptide transporter (OPT) family protein